MYGTFCSCASPDLVLHPAVGGVDLHPQAALPQHGGELLRGLDVPVGDRDHDGLHRREPQREGTAEVLDQDPDETLKAA